MRVAAAALICSLVATAGIAQPRPLPGFSPKTMDYLNAAAQSDRFEIIEGDLAARYSRNAAIRTFGQRMMRDHAQSTRMLLGAAARSGL